MRLTQQDEVVRVFKTDPNKWTEDDVFTATNAYAEVFTMFRDAWLKVKPSLMAISAIAQARYMAGAKK